MKGEIELDVVDLAYNGKSVGYLDGKVTFVNGGLPGERIMARLTKSKRRYNDAILLRVLTPSSERIQPICQHYDVCGGCTWQDLDYQRQLFYKRNQVIASLEHIGALGDVVVEDIRSSPDTFFYRNKMEFSFHTCSPQTSARGFILGLHERGRFDSIFDVVCCHLQSDLSNRLVNFIREKTAELGLPAYDLIEHQGFLRFAVVREGKNTGQVMLILVTADDRFPAQTGFLSALKSNFPELTTIVWVVNPGVTNIARGELREVLHGPGYIEEEILGYRFRIAPGSFFQTNSRQTENLYRTAIDLAGIRDDDTILDLYCGAGTIGLCAADRARAVVGIDIETEAIDAARLNAKLNKVKNARFYAGDVRQVMRADEMKEEAFDPVFVDPPRVGMHPRALARLLEAAPRRIVYISCNPATFARDAKQLAAFGYVLETVIPFDMFPHTMHIELVSRFTKKG